MYALLRLVMRVAVGVYLAGLWRLEGAGLVPPAGPLLICANHQSTIDPPMIPAFIARGDTWSMAKSEFFRTPLKRWIFTAYHAFPVVRHSPDRAALRRSLDIIRGGGALVVYPEGTRVEEGGLIEAEPGAGFIARSLGCPVLPVAVSGTRACFPKGSIWPRRVRVTMRVGRPIVVNERRPDGTRVTNREATDAIMVAIAEQLDPAERGVYADLDALRRRLRGVTTEGTRL